MTNLELAKQQGNQAAPNVIDAAKASEVQIDITLAQEQGNQATPLIADSLVGSESYDAIKQQGNQAMPLIVDALVQPTPPTPTESPMYFEAVEANSTVTMTSTLDTAPNLEYSIDGVTWQEWQHTTAEGIHTFDTITLGAVGDRVYLRGDNPNGLGAFPEGAEHPIFSVFMLTGLINCGGNVMSLLDATMELTEVPQFGFYGLFSVDDPGPTALLTPPSMNTIIAIGEYGCYSMYSDCTSLTAAADMPSLTTIGYEGCSYMYAACTSLTMVADMPVLTAIGGYGCYSMYAGCTSLTSAANMPALITISGGGCEDMYNNCTFNMSDDGTTLNFDFPAPPVTAGEETYETAYDVAEWMGNTNGLIE